MVTVTKDGMVGNAVKSGSLDGDMARRDVVSGFWSRFCMILRMVIWW